MKTDAVRDFDLACVTNTLQYQLLRRQVGRDHAWSELPVRVATLGFKAQMAKVTVTHRGCQRNTGLDGERCRCFWAIQLLELSERQLRECVAKIREHGLATSAVDNDRRGPVTQVIKRL